VGIVTRRTSGALLDDVQLVLLETAIGKHAILNIVAFIAQRVTRQRIGYSGRVISRRGGREFQHIVAFENMRNIGSVWPAGEAAGDSQISSGIAIVAIRTINLAATRKWSAIKG
jgi:hypothetical protein